MSWLTAHEIALGTGKAIGSVYRLASVHRWRRLPGRPTRYLVADVVGSMFDTPQAELDMP